MKSEGYTLIKAFSQTAGSVPAFRDPTVNYHRKVFLKYTVIYYILSQVSMYWKVQHSAWSS